MSRLKGKTAVITGGGTGIGLGAAQRFVEEGAFVYLFGRRQEQLDAAVAKLGTSARTVRGSVTEMADLDRLYETVKTERGGLDILFANAGTGAFAPLGAITPQQYDQIFDVNVKGLIFSVQKGLPLMKGGGSIILTGSTTGEMGTPQFSIYSATKAAVRNLARSWALDLKGTGIRVNVLHRRPTIVFRTEPLVAGAGGVRVTVAGTPDVVGDAADVWTVFASANGTTLRRTRAGVTTTIGTGASVTVHWSGTRDAASTGTGAALLHLSTSVAGLSGTSLQFRYGTMDFASAVGSPTTLEAVNTVRVHDEYLLGISEVSSSWPMESLRAQVLASRSYALAHVATSPRAACRCHVDNGYGGYYDQTFVGYSKETSTAGSRWRQAVLSTDTTASTGEAILYAGKAISAEASRGP